MFKTQESSKPRLKNDTLGDQALVDLYDSFTACSAAAFQQKCVDLVQAGGGKQERKNEIINAIVAARSKAQQLKKAQDFILAGMGLGV
jgi:hypothetical protein